MPLITFQYFRSASFPPDSSLQPAVRLACRYARIWRDRTTANRRHRVNDWVIDCGHCAGLRVRSPNPASPWVERAAGVVHVYAPHTSFWEDNSAVWGQPFAGSYLVFSDKGSHLKGLTDPGRGVARVTDADGSLAQAFDLAFMGSDTPERWTCQAGLARLIGLLRMAEHQDADVWRVGGASVRPAFTALIDAWLEKHLAERIMVAGLARHLGMAASTLAHRYRKATGSTPMRRLAELRVHHLQVLLAKGATLGDAAAACGFCDGFHASRRFRAVTGQTPRAWLAAARLD